MAIIYSYPEVTPTLSDTVIGTQFDESGNPTKSFLISDIVDLAITTLPPGPTGPQGSTGPAGPIGPQGPTGSSGSAGPQGQQGVPGPVGPAGLNWQGTWSSANSYSIDDAVGYSGASWFCISPTGATVVPPNGDPAHWSLLASQGAAGPQGPAGSTGSAGATGSQGPAGLTGAQGLQGIPGIPGATGATGSQGPTGPIGPQGSQGAAGTAGAAGAQGVPGPVGPAGLNWQGVWVPGNVYAVDDAVGFAGASYFCIATTGGVIAPNLDTTYWALLAAQGAQGTPGVPGPTGLTGTQGPAGNTGPAGPQGPIGPTGATGATGPAGSGGGITSLNALTNTSQILTTGTIGNNFTVNSTGNTHTFLLPDTSATARGVLNTGAQTINGVKTFLFTPVAPTASLIANDTQLATTQWVRSVAVTLIGLPTGSGNTNGGLITGTVLQLSPATTTTPGIVTTGGQSFSGTKTFNNNISVNGMGVGRGANSAANCVSVGGNSLVGNTGVANTCFGDNTMPFNISGFSNTVIGNGAGYFMTGALNTAVGQDSLYSNSGTTNVGIGANAGATISSGSGNVCIGVSSGGISNGSGNVCIGTNSGGNIGTGSNNIHVGSNTTSSASSNTNEIIIGTGVSGNGSNTVSLGNGATQKTFLKGQVLVNGSMPDNSAALQIDSGNRGFLPPRVASTASITAPVPGLIIYDQSVAKLKCWNGTIWNDLF